MAQPTLSDGTTTLTLFIDSDISETESPNIVRHNIPSRNGVILQDMGRGSLEIPLSGYTTSQSEKNTLKTWMRDRTKLIYNDDENTNVNVIIVSPGIITRKTFPGYYEYNITIIEIE